MQICYCKQKGYKGYILGFLVLFDCVVFCQAALIIIFVRFYLTNKQQLTTNKQQTTNHCTLLIQWVWGVIHAMLGLLVALLKAEKTKKKDKVNTNHRVYP